MKLIDVYVHEVTRRLPEKMRGDIAMELRSTIEDMLPDDYTKEEVKGELEKLGNPALLAAQYTDRPMYLIGPKFYDIYITILKMALSIATLVVIILFLIGKFSWFIGNETLPLITGSDLLGEIFGILLETALQVFFWVTIVFIILERTVSPAINVPLTLTGAEWKPDDLENITYVPVKKAIKKSEIIFGLFWMVIWTILYFNATKLVGVYEKTVDQGGLEFTIPVFNGEILMSYWPIVVFFIVLEIALLIFKAISRQWTYRLAISNLVVHLASIVFLITIISNPSLLNPEFVTFMAALFEIPQEKTNDMISWFTWNSIIVVIIISSIDSYTGFRKARIK